MKTSLLFIISIFLLYNLASQPLTPVEDTIPMRDGKTLAADIYIPSGAMQRPTILIQTSYSKFWYRYNLPLGIGTGIDTSAYNFVIVDWRCFYASVSACIATPNRGEDGYDVIDWIKDQTWSDGQIGTWGPSALGKVQFQTAREKHPNHTCAVPLVAGPQFEYQEYFHGGVYRTAYVEQLDALGYGMSAFLLSNPFYSATWQWVENNNWYPAEIEIPMFMIGGWYDHNTDLMIEFFNAIKQQSPVGAQHKLLMGPWAHGGFGTAQVGTAQQGELFYYGAENWNDSLAMMFFNYYMLNNINGWDANPAINYFQMGENTWQSSAIWPTTNTTNYNLYLNTGGLLDINAPPNPNTFSNFDYNPRDPSPTIGGATLNQNLLQGPYNQADTVEIRNDILIFTTDELIQDIKLIGKPVVHLFVSSNRLDTDFAIRLTDVYPDSSSMILAESIRRMRFRNGYTIADTASMVSGQIYEIEIELKNTANTFLAGHKIRIDITSSNYPRFDKNLNNGQEMYVAGDTLIASNTVYHGSDYSSYIEFPFVDYVQSELSVNNTMNFSIYPNPCNNILYVHTPIIDTYQITIYDIYGKTYYKRSMLNVSAKKNLIDISELDKGIYFIKITDNKNITSIKKLIKI